MADALLQSTAASQSFSPPGRLRIAIGIATRGRPSVLADTLTHLAAQRRAADAVLVAYGAPADLGDAKERFPHVRFILSEPGLTKQRNAILASLATDDVVTFLDDDFYLHPDYLSVIEQVFSADARVVVATGTLLADGINGPGLSLQQAEKLLSQSRSLETNHTVTRAYNAYGCNMSLRLKQINQHGLRFDENLPLYGWYEDVDFSRQLSPYGDIIRIGNAYGVHLGIKSGRQSGMRLGYSQVANPVYLAKKKSVTWLYAVASVVSRSLKNLLLCAAPEPYVDRRGRLKGNIRGFYDLFLGTLSPTRILDF